MKGDAFEMYFSRWIDEQLERWSEEVDVVLGPTSLMNHSGYRSARKIDTDVTRVELNLNDRLDSGTFVRDSALHDIYEFEMKNLKDRERFQVDKLLFIRA